MKSWAVTLCKSNSSETNKNTCLHTEFCKNLCGEKKGKYTQNHHSITCFPCESGQHAEVCLLRRRQSQTTRLWSREQAGVQPEAVHARGVLGSGRVWSAAKGASARLFHLLLPESDIFFPCILSRLNPSLNQGFYSKVTSSERSSLTSQSNMRISSLLFLDTSQLFSY